MHVINVFYDFVTFAFRLKYIYNRLRIYKKTQGGQKLVFFKPTVLIAEQRLYELFRTLVFSYPIFREYNQNTKKRKCTLVLCSRSREVKTDGELS